MTSGPERILWPLSLFQAAEASAEMAPLAGKDMPPPYRDLLVHENDMTPTLEAHYGETIYVDRLHGLNEHGWLSREVLLCLTESNRIVAYGASHINPAFLPAKALAILDQGKVPLGAILSQFQVSHSSHPAGFFSIVSATCAAKLGAAPTDLLYGRSNALHAADGRVIAEVCEILPLNGSELVHEPRT